MQTLLTAIGAGTAAICGLLLVLILMTPVQPTRPPVPEVAAAAREDRVPDPAPRPVVVPAVRLQPAPAAASQPAVRDVTRDPHVNGTPPVAAVAPDGDAGPEATGSTLPLRGSVAVEEEAAPAAVDPQPAPDAVEAYADPDPAPDPALAPAAPADEGPLVLLPGSEPAAPAAEGQPAATAEAAGGEPRFPPGKGGCTKYRTYNPETQTYRGFDGKIHECKPL
jgi:hypothetical protein